MTTLEEVLTRARNVGGVRTLDKATYVRTHTLKVPASVGSLDASHAQLVYETDGVLDVEGSEIAYPDEKNVESGRRTRASIEVAKGVALRRLRVKGANAGSDYVKALEAQHGIRALGGNAIEDVRVEGVYGDGVYLTGDDSTLTRALVLGTGRQGIGFTNGRRLAISDSYLVDIGRSVVDLEPKASIGEEVHDVTISNLHVGRYGLGFSAGRGGLTIGLVGNGLIRGVTVRGVHMLDGALFTAGTSSSTTPHRVSDVVFEDVGSEPGTAWNRATLSFRNVDGLTIKGWHQEFTTTKRGTDGKLLPVLAANIAECTDVTFVDCDIPGGYVPGHIDYVPLAA